MAPVRIFSWVCFGAGCVTLIVLSLVAVGLWEQLYNSVTYETVDPTYHLLRSLGAFLILLIALIPFSVWAVLIAVCEIHDRLDEQNTELSAIARASPQPRARRGPTPR